MQACLCYGRGRIDKALKIGGQFEDIEMGYLMCDTGFTLEQIEALPRRMQRTLRMITKAKRILEQRRVM